MGRFRWAALGVGTLVVGVLLGIWIADRLRANGRDASGADWNAVARTRTALNSGTPLARSPSAAGGVQRGSKPRVSLTLPAPKLPARSTETVPEERWLPPLLKQLLGGGVTNKLTRERLEPYLRANKRSAASRLAAARVTRDRSFLREAVQNFPQEPRVLLDCLLFGDLTPAEQRQVLDAFCRAAPQNVLGNYGAAFALFESGDVDGALRGMGQAADKTCMEASHSRHACI